MQSKTGGAAFPRPMSVSHGAYGDHQGIIFEQAGMTLRQYYKAKVAAGWLASFGSDAPSFEGDTKALKNFAEFASALADALLAEDVEFEAKQQGGGE